MPRGCLQFVIVVFPDHTHLLFLSYWCMLVIFLMHRFDVYSLHNPPCKLNIMLQQQQNLERRFGTSKMHLSPLMTLAAVHSKVMVLLLLIRCWLLLPLWDSVIVLHFVVRYFVSILVLQSSRWGGESWLLCFVCLLVVSWLLCGSS